MPITQLDSENSEHADLTSTVTVLTHTPDASNPRLCQGCVALGDGTDDLDGSGGGFELTVSVGGQTINGGPETILFGTEARGGMWTSVFPVPADKEVVIKVKSPNAADVDVGVEAYLFDVGDVVDAHIARAAAANKWKYNQDTALTTVYDDDDTTVLYQTQLNSEEDGTVVVEEPV